jgi:hypothetical protein
MLKIKSQQCMQYVQAYGEEIPNVNINLYGEETTEHYKKDENVCSSRHVALYFSLTWLTPSRDMARE